MNAFKYIRKEGMYMATPDLEDVEKLKEKILQVIKEKLEDGTLDKNVVKTIRDENGRLRRSRVVITDPNEYFEYLIERKRLITNDIYSDEYLLKLILRDDLKVRERFERRAPTDINEVKIGDLDEGSSEFSIKGKILDYTIRTVHLKRDNRAIRVMSVYIADDTGNIELGPLWEGDNTEEIFRLADDNNLRGKTISVSEAYINTKNKYSPFPFTISPTRDASISVSDEEIEGDIDLKPISEINENVSVASFEGKIHKTFDLSVKNWESDDGKTITFKSKNFIVIDKNGNSKVVRARQDSADHVPNEGDVVRIKYGKVIKDAWRVDRGYSDPIVIEVFHPFQIERIEGNAEDYPERIGMKITESDLFDAGLGTIKFIGMITNFTFQKWNENEKKMEYKPPYYLSCGVDGCKKKVTEIDGKYICSDGHIPTEETIKKRFICNAIVSDFTSEFKTLISGEIAEKILGKSEEALIEEAESMELDQFFDYINSWNVSISDEDEEVFTTPIFLITGSVSVDEWGARFNIRDVERISAEEGAEMERQKLVAMVSDEN